MDQITSKLITMHKSLHPRDDIDILYVRRKEDWSEINSIEYCVDASIQRPKKYTKKS